MTDLPAISIMPNHGNKYSHISKATWERYEAKYGPLGCICNITDGGICDMDETPWKIELTRMRTAVQKWRHEGWTFDAATTDLEHAYNRAFRYMTDDLPMALAAECYAMEHLKRICQKPVGRWGMYPYHAWPDEGFYTSSARADLTESLFDCPDFQCPDFYAYDVDRKEWWDTLLGRKTQLLEYAGCDPKNAVACLWWLSLDGTRVSMSFWKYMLSQIWKAGYRRVTIWGNDSTKHAQKKFGITADPDELADEQWPYLVAVGESRFNRKVVNG